MAKEKPQHDIVAIAAIVIAVVSIVVSVWQAAEERTHNRLSVKPKLEIIFRSDTNQIATFTISNHGLGPAIIKKLTTFVNRKEIATPDLAGLFVAIDSLGLRQSVVQFDPIVRGISIPADASRIIVQFDLKKYPGDPSEIKIYEALGFFVDYESMYGESDTRRFNQ
ncbi:MAG: hypothetical protein KDD94_10175 [Calditrichaeota bacterium]|nr:hypothetical protein [Calditrichota bacterium]